MDMPKIKEVTFDKAIIREVQRRALDKTEFAKVFNKMKAKVIATGKENLSALQEAFSAYYDALQEKNGRTLRAKAGKSNNQHESLIYTSINFGFTSLHT